MLGKAVQHRFACPRVVPRSMQRRQPLQRDEESRDGQYPPSWWPVSMVS
jgi:hypothetical protein